MPSLMRPLLRPANLFLLLTYALLTAVPFIPALLGRPLEHPWQMLSFELLAEHGRQERDAERDRVLGIMLNTPRGDSMTEWLESVARQASNVVQPGGE